MRTLAELPFGRIVRNLEQKGHRQRDGGEAVGRSLPQPHPWPLAAGELSPGYITLLSFSARFACWEDRGGGGVSGDMVAMCRSSNVGGGSAGPEGVNRTVILRGLFRCKL
jgi:hypothetical protein